MCYLVIAEKRILYHGTTIFLILGRLILSQAKCDRVSTDVQYIISNILGDVRIQLLIESMIEMVCSVDMPSTAYSPGSGLGGASSVFLQQ